jgi:hypothetical protein
MSKILSFAKLYGMKIMLLGFTTLAVGAVGNVTTSAPWSVPVIALGLIIYSVGRVLQVLLRRSR